MKRIVVWFRNDLRLHDHIALCEALQKAEEVIPVYCIDDQFLAKKDGSSRTNSFRLAATLSAVQNLKSNFQAIGGDLIVVRGKPEELISEIASRYQANAVYAFKEVAWEEVRSADRVEEHLWKFRIPLHQYIGNTLYNKEDLPFPIKDIPDIFSNFRKRLERDAIVRPCVPTPSRIRIPTDLQKSIVPSVTELGFEIPATDPRISMDYSGGETAALAHFQKYVWEDQHLLTYKETRNQLIGASYSSKLSTWLSLGCISPRKVYWEIQRFEKEVEANESTYWLYFELLWRDYFRFMFKKHGNALFREDGIRRVIRTDKSCEQEIRFEAWKNGCTGIPFIDANMRELNATGFMSNRGRQNVASYLINDLHITWTKGAEYFEEKLIDYNPSSNWGNWAYLAGVGNDPREQRYFNIDKQARDYDASGEYVRLWLPELQKVPTNFIHQPYLLSAEQQVQFNCKIGEDYPSPVIPKNKSSYSH
jgi:deoxyribodipyrimidine photo-lyase